MSSISTDKKDIRKFGFTGIIFFGCLCALGLLRKKSLPTYLFGALSLLGIAFLMMPSQMKPVYLAWLSVAHFLGRIVSTTILVVAYYLVITPAALLKRLFGGRPLPLKPDKHCASYWVPRAEPAQPKERFVKRY